MLLQAFLIRLKGFKIHSTAIIPESSLTFRKAALTERKCYRAKYITFCLLLSSILFNITVGTSPKLKQRDASAAALAEKAYI